MNWVDNVHRKAEIIHGQIAWWMQQAEHARLDAQQACAPYYALLSQIYAEDLPFARVMDESDIVIRAHGPQVETDAPRVRIVESLLADLREEVARIAKTVIGLAPGERARMPGDFALRLCGLARGSLVVGLKIAQDEATPGQQQIPEAAEPMFDAVRTAVKSISLIPHYLTENGVRNEISEILPDPGVRDAALVAAQRLAPSGRRGIDRITLLDPRNAKERTPGELTHADRGVLKHVLRNPMAGRKVQRGEFVGIVREVDLDASRFEIRGVTQYGALRCVYPGMHHDHARALLNTWVRVTGQYESTADGRPRLLQVDSVREELAPRDGELFPPDDL